MQMIIERNRIVIGLLLHAALDNFLRSHYYHQEILSLFVYIFKKMIFPEFFALICNKIPAIITIIIIISLALRITRRRLQFPLPPRLTRLLFEAFNAPKINPMHGPLSTNSFPFAGHFIEKFKIENWNFGRPMQSWKIVLFSSFLNGKWSQFGNWRGKRKKTGLNE